MARKHYKPEEIVGMLRQAEVLHGLGMSMADATRQLGISDVGTVSAEGGTNGGSALIWPALPQAPENHRKKPSILPNVGEACRSAAGLSFIVDLRHREQTRREPLHGL